MADLISTNLWGIYLEKFFLSRSYFWDKEKITTYQLNNLNRILKEAKKLKGYEELTRQQPAVDNWKDFVKLPILNKNLIKENLNDYVTGNRKKLIEDHTSGSTGNPTTVFLTPKQKALEFGYLLRYYHRFNYRIGHPIAVFRSYIPKSDQDSLTRYRRSRNELLFSVYHMTPDNLDNYVKEYNAFKPKFIRGYPSSIYIVANHILQNNISVHKPLGVFCSSEVLTPQFKSVIEKAFGAPAINWYGSNERAITASQCQYRNGLHVHEEAGILEVVNEKGESSITNRAVTEGEIVVTGVVNAAMPLIRYRLGDYGILETEPCSCGFQGTTLKEIVGRTDDIIVTPAGKSVPPVRFYTLFEKFPSVNGFQIVQQKDGQHIAVNIISKTKVDEAKLLEALSYFVGNDVNFTINYVEEIKAEASGKRKLIKVLK